MSQKIEFVLKALQTHNFPQLCQDYGISTKTGYKWRERFFQHGLAGLQELSRRPNGHAKEVGEKVICAMVKLKHKHPTWGPLHPAPTSPSTINHQPSLYEGFQVSQACCE